MNWRNLDPRLTDKEVRQLEKMEAKLRKRIQPQLDAIRASEKLSASDCAVRINARDD